jgi:hypothetical protein
MDETTKDLIGMRVAEGQWSEVGWDQDTETAEIWLQDIEQNYDGNIQNAIDRLYLELADLLECTEVLTRGDLERREEDIEFHVVELARLQSMRDRLLV